MSLLTDQPESLPWRQSGMQAPMFLQRAASTSFEELHDLEVIPKRSASFPDQLGNESGILLYSLYFVDVPSLDSLWASCLSGVYLPKVPKARPAHTKQHGPTRPMFIVLMLYPQPNLQAQ